jgi:hypothetical protein
LGIFPSSFWAKFGLNYPSIWPAGPRHGASAGLGLV